MQICPRHIEYHIKETKSKVILQRRIDAVMLSYRRQLQSACKIYVKILHLQYRCKTAKSYLHRTEIGNLVNLDLGVVFALRLKDALDLIRGDGINTASE